MKSISSKTVNGISAFRNKSTRRQFAQATTTINPYVTVPPPLRPQQEELIPKAKPLLEILSSISIQTILDINCHPVVDITQQSMVYDAVKLMSDNRIGSVVVTDPKSPKKEMAGIFTERDYIRKIILQNLSSKKTPIHQVMTKDVMCGYGHWNMVDCIKAMTLGKFRHLPVLAGHEGEEGIPKIAIGMISSRDVMRYLTGAVEIASDSELVENVRLNDVFNKICRKSARTCYVGAKDTVLTALQEMYKHNLGALFVYEETELVGIFTERDYLHKVILRGKLSKETKVEDVMTKSVIFAGPMDSALTTLKLMATSGIRNIPVMPLIGQSIDYVDGKDYATIGMLNEVDFIKYAYTKLKDTNQIL